MKAKCKRQCTRYGIIMGVKCLRQAWRWKVILVISITKPQIPPMSLRLCLWQMSFQSEGSIHNDKIRLPVLWTMIFTSRFLQKRKWLKMAVIFFKPHQRLHETLHDSIQKLFILNNICWWTILKIFFTFLF